MEIRVKITRNGSNQIRTMPLEEYLRGVVPSEMPASWLVEALKAQAIAARTYAMDKMRRRQSQLFDVDDTTSYQAYRHGTSDARTDAAIQATAGQYLAWADQPIEAVFSASNGGAVVSAKARWGNDVPYLQAATDPYDKQPKNGHGVGMSQWGAKGRADAGHTCEAILAFYYPGATLIVPEVPPEAQPEPCEQILAQAKALELLIADLCPEGRERSVAIERLTECAMWANASITHNE